MTVEAIIPPYLISTNKTVADNIINFCVEHGVRHKIDPMKAARIEVDNMRMEFYQTQLIIAEKNMKIKIIQS